MWLRLLKNEIGLDNLHFPLVLARVGIDHVKRRHGIPYALKEINFLKICWADKFMPWWQIVALLIVRMPMQLAPREMYAYFTRKPLRIRIY